MTEQQQLARWETWPLWALGLSNGLNLSIWFVTSMLDVQTTELSIRLPSYVNVFLPHLIVLGGLAAAGSLDGVLVATLAGVRQGRKGNWTWATLVSAAAFSALISYALHAGKISEWPWLHMAMMAVMLPYNFHLSQPRKALHLPKETKSLDDSIAEPTGHGKCKKCGGSHPRLVDYKLCKGSIADHWPEGEIADLLSQPVTVVRHAAEDGRRNGVNHS